MGKAQERGLREVLEQAEGLANVLRAMSGGRLDLQPVVKSQPGGRFAVEMSWEGARTEARQIAKAPAPSARDILTAGETFCSVCGHLDEPGIHTMADCPRYDHPVGSTEDRLEAIEMALATQRALIELVRTDIRAATGPAIWHGVGACQRCGDTHSPGEAEQLNALLAGDRDHGSAPTGRPGPGGAL